MAAGGGSADELVRRFYEDAWNRWDDAVVDELLAEEFTFRGSLGDEVVGRNGWREYRDRLHRAVPDLHNEIVELISRPAQVAVRLRCSGHHHGVLLGRLGWEQAIEWEGAAFFRCAAGHLTSAWVLGDLDALRRQLLS